MTYKPLLFQKRFIPLILDGSKTQTRRPLYENNIKVGDILALRAPWSRKTYGLIDIVRVYEHPIGEITEEEVEREGFKSLAEFKKAWGRIYGDINGREVIRVYEFRVVAGRPLSQEDLRRPQP